MKKNFLLTLVLGLLCTATAWAQFAPEAGKMYALKETTSGLYLDIQTGVNDANSYYDDNLCLSANPCVIYFAAGTTDASKWTMKNVNGEYVMQGPEGRYWIVRLGETAYEWTIAEPEAGKFTIARADGKFIGADNTTAGVCLYCNINTGLKFSLVEYSTLQQAVYTLKSPTDTYLNWTTSGDTPASFQATPTEFYVIPSGDTYFFQKKDNANEYIGCAQNGWSVSTDFAVWSILADGDFDGFVQIARASDATKYLGSDQNTTVETGVYTNVSNECYPWYFEGTFSNYATAGTLSNSKYHFTSGWIYTAGPCNKIRFTLTESGGKFQSGKNRLSLDEFVLYNAEGEAVELDESDITGNNGKTYAGFFDGVNDTFGGTATWDAGTEDDWFEILLPLGTELGGAFKFSFVTENTTMNAKEFTITMSYEQPADYTFAISNAPDGAVVTFDGNPIANGDKIAFVAFDEDLLVATDIQGYTWSVVVDNENETITLVYTKAEIVDNPQAVVDLLNRIGGEGTADKFKIVLDPSMNSRNEVFSINGEDGKILIKGTTISAITTGIGWYLQNIAHINIAWNSLNEKTVSGDAYADLSSIPVPTAEEVHTSDAMYRYYLNYCTFGYSMTTWTWNRWQQEIDWMALHGINMPLQIVGLEEVWRKFLTMEEGGKRKYGYTDEEAKAFVPGPAYTAWWGMNNLEGYGGTSADGKGGVQDDAWYKRQATLAADILARQRELGMQPVLPGFSGMVPTNFTEKTGIPTDENGYNWGGFERPEIIEPDYADYASVAADYYACLKEVMGESQYYSMDPFHEGGSLTGDTSDEMYIRGFRNVYDAMEQANPASQWVIQQWQWYDYQRLSLKAVPEGRLIVLDLFSDGSPAFTSNGVYSYAPHDAVFCAIPNFGGRSGLMGRLQNVTDNYFNFKGQYELIKGIGAAPEAIEQTPVTYDLIFQLPWMNGVKPDVAEWVENYAIARYGQDNEEIKEAWDLLRQGPLNYGADGIQGPIEDVWAARPNLNANYASSWGSTLSQSYKGYNVQGTYTPARRQMLIDATYKLLSQSGKISGETNLSNYSYDLVEFGGAVLADYAHYLLLGIRDAKNAAGTNFATDATYIARRNAFLQLILDVDAFKGTNLNFRLGKWTQEARLAAKEAVDLGATTATADWYEYNNARTLITTWGDSENNGNGEIANGLKDYSYRSWQGLLKDYYLPRWKYYFDNDCSDPNGSAKNYFYFEWNWAHGKEHYVGQTAKSDVALTAEQAGHSSKYTREPEGNTVDVATEVLGKYIIPVASGDGTYYAYRYLSNDLSSVCTVIASAGGFVDLSTYFGELEGATISGDFIDSQTGTSTNFNALPIKANATDGAHTGTITLADGTVLTFAVVINPAFNGVYTLHVTQGTTGNYFDINKDVFVAYNTNQTDNPKSVGYKLLGEGDFSSTATADKYFTILPFGTGYSIQAQGVYMKAPQNVSDWGHILFSDNSAEAGVYLIEEPETGIYDIKSAVPGATIPYLNAWASTGVNYIFGNDNKYSKFTITQVTEYTVNVPSTGFTTLYLPFNVVLPTGVTAYTVEPAKIMDDGNGGYGYILTQVATTGETLLKGTPVIIKAAAGDHVFGVTVDNTNAKSVASSALCGTYFAQTVNSLDATKKYSVTVENGEVVFGRIDSDTGIASNSCWLETSANVEKITKLTSISLVDGGVYRIKGQLSNGKLRTLYTNGAKNNIKWTEETKTDASTLFIVKKSGEKYYLISALANGVWSNERTLAEEGVALTLTEGSVAPTFMIVGDGNRRFAVPGTETSGDVNYYSNCNDAVGTFVNEENSTDFLFEQANASEVSFTVHFKKNQAWATMFLPFAVSTNATAKAYTSTLGDIKDKVISLTQVNDVIPARTAVLLSREDKNAKADFKFTYTTDSGSDYNNNLFKGYVQQTAVPVDKDTEKCYLLLTQQSGEAMYWVYAEYNENCVATNPGTDNGGYVKCEANRAYMLLNSAQANSAKYSFRFPGETTAIEEVKGENVKVKTIYDLQGRKLTEITEPGVYIINGKKSFIK